MESVPHTQSFSGRVTLLCRNIDGKRYGAAAITLTIGGCPIDAVAVIAGDDKWVSSRDDCIDWLSNHGLGFNLAAGLIADALIEQGARAAEKRRQA
jgi:hypothetical protein